MQAKNDWLRKIIEDDLLKDCKERGLKEPSEEEIENSLVGLKNNASEALMGFIRPNEVLFVRDISGKKDIKHRQDGNCQAEGYAILHMKGGKARRIPLVARSRRFDILDKDTKDREIRRRDAALASLVWALKEALADLKRDIKARNEAAHSGQISTEIIQI